VAHFVESASEIDALGARLVVIGNGSVDALGRFADRYSPAVEFCTDPDCESYGALGMMRGVGSFLSIKMLRHAARASRDGHRQGKTQGNPLQQGGVCVFAQGGELLFVHRDSTAGDHIHPERIIEVLGQLKSAT